MLEIIAKDHELWVSMAINMGCQRQVAEDIVQEMYLRIHKFANSSRIMYDDNQVNRFYIYVTIRNLYYDYRKSVKRHGVVDMQDFDFDALEFVTPLATEPTVEDKEFAVYRLAKRVIGEIHTWGTYNSNLCEKYFRTDMSLRFIARESDISLTSIHNSIKKYRAFLVEEFGEDYEDYKNGDYHLM